MILGDGRFQQVTSYEKMADFWSNNDRFRTDFRPEVDQMIYIMTYLLARSQQDVKNDFRLMFIRDSSNSLGFMILSDFI